MPKHFKWKHDPNNPNNGWVYRISTGTAEHQAPIPWSVGINLVRMGNENNPNYEVAMRNLCGQQKRT